MENPFHEGDLKIQSLVGEDEIAKRNGQVIKNEILAGALDFIAKQSMVILGSVSKMYGKHWASVVSGSAGFISTHGQKTLLFDLNLINKVEDDPLWQNLEAGRRLGVLFIELETRRRLKVNGIIEISDKNQIQLVVEESYPLCPKYIQRRRLDLASDTSKIKNEMSRGSKLDEKTKDVITQSDTAFLVTSHASRGLDVSHRGGKKGFLKVVSDDQIRCPDYSGNSMFNSFGNLEENPQSGLVVVDFKNATALQLTGEAYVELDQEDEDNQTNGTGRFWTFKIESWILQPLYLAQREFLDYSPFLP